MYIRSSSTRSEGVQFWSENWNSTYSFRLDAAPETVKLVHYVRYNQFFKSSLKVGDPAPDLKLVMVNPQPWTSIADTREQHPMKLPRFGRPIRDCFAQTHAYSHYWPTSLDFSWLLLLKRSAKLMRRMSGHWDMTFWSISKSQDKQVPDAPRVLSEWYRPCRSQQFPKIICLLAPSLVYHLAQWTMVDDDSATLPCWRIWYRGWLLEFSGSRATTVFPGLFFCWNDGGIRITYSNEWRVWLLIQFRVDDFSRKIINQIQSGYPFSKNKFVDLESKLRSTLKLYCCFYFIPLKQPRILAKNERKLHYFLLS